MRAGRNLWLLGLASLLTDLSTEMVYPLLPLFLTTLGGTALALGLMEGLAEAVSSSLKYASGRASDRWQRPKPLAVLGYTVSAVAKLGYPVAARVVDVVLLRTADRVGKGIRGAPRDALVAESMPRRRWGYAFGFHRALDTTGALLGPVAALALLPLIGLRPLFAAAVVPGLLGVLMLLFVRERRRRPSPAPSATRAVWTTRLLSYYGIVALFTFANLGLVFLLLRAVQFGFDAAQILLLYVAYNATYAALALPLGAWTDRVGRVPVVGLAFVGLTLASLFAATLRPGAPLDFAAPALLFGLASAAFEGNGRALAADLAPARARATVLGGYHATIGFAALPAGLAAGLVADVNFPAVFLAGAAAAAVGLVALLAIGPDRLGRRFP